MIGVRDTYIEIEQPTKITNELGEELNEWSLLEAAWASKKLKSSGESVEGGALSSKAVYELSMDYIPSLTGQMRINLDGEILNIIGHESPYRSRTVITAEATSYERRN